jgi:hypothetical protein
MLGLVEAQHGEAGAARPLFQQALEIYRSQGRSSGEAVCLGNLAILEFRQGNYGLAGELVSRSLRLECELGQQWGMAESCAVAGAILLKRGMRQAAAVCLQGARQAAAALAYHFEPYERQLIDEASGAFSPQEAEAGQAQGAALSLAELAQFALAALADASSTGSG